MRMHTGWLALLIVGACGTAASAQSPLMYGMQPYPPFPYLQPMPNYAVPPRFAAPAYQPQPRVVYVPADSATWQTAPVPAQTATRSNQVPANVPSTAGSTNSPVIVAEPALAPKSPTNVPARTASQRRSVVAYELDETCGPEGCAAPAARWHDDTTNWLAKGHWDLQFMGGWYNDVGDAHYNWAQTSIRIGRVWNCECFSCLPGAFEGLIDVTGASVVDSDFGNYFFGSGLLFRYNFVKPGSRVVPYAQAGVGFQYNDAFHDLNQSYLGSRIELTAQGQLGLRVFLTKCFSLDLEGGFQHFSDLGRSNRNDGINALGGMAGMTFFLPCCGRR